MGEGGEGGEKGKGGEGREGKGEGICRDPENGLPGPALALGGPAWEHSVLIYRTKIVGPSCIIVLNHLRSFKVSGGSRLPELGGKGGAAEILGGGPGV